MGFFDDLIPKATEVATPTDPYGSFADLIPQAQPAPVASTPLPERPVTPTPATAYSSPEPAPDQRSLAARILDPFGTTEQLGKGIARGAIGAFSAGAEALGYEGASDRASELAQSPAIAPEVGGWRDVSGPLSGARWVAGMAGESAPEMAATTLAAAGGTLAAGAAVGIGAGLATSAFFNTGRNLQRQEEETGETSYGRAISAGLAQGGLDVLVPGRFVGALGSRILGNMAERGIIGAGKDITNDALKEGATEVGQQLIEIGQANPELLRVMLAPNDDAEAKRADELLSEVVDSMVGGAALGGAMGAVGTIGQREQAPAPEAAPARPPVPRIEPPMAMATPEQKVARDIVEDQALYEQAEEVGRQIDAAQAAGEPLERIRELQAEMGRITAQREIVQSPIDTDLIREGQDILDKVARGEPLPPKLVAPEVDETPAVAPVETPARIPHPDIPADEAAILFGAGYDAENIYDMAPEERAAEIAEARDQNVEAIAPDLAAQRIADFRATLDAAEAEPQAETPARPASALEVVQNPEPIRDERPMAEQAAAPEQNRFADLIPEPEPTRIPDDERDTDVVSLDPARVKSDAQRFQFKSGGDAQGVTEQLRGVKQWDSDASGVALVWEDNAGERFIVDGHQRLGLAQRLQAEGQKPRIRAIMAREKDGVTAAEAMYRGAIKNLQEGGESTTSVDVAKVFRRGGTTVAVQERIPPERAAYRDGMALSKLSDDSFNLVVNERISPAFAAEVGRGIEGDAPQIAALDYLMKHPPKNREEARLIVGQMKADGFATETQGSLFGDVETATPLFTERARILDNSSRYLSAIGKVFKTAINSESVLAEAGNVLDSVANQKGLSENAQLAVALERLSQRKGPVSDALSEQARRVASGEITIAEARKRFLEAVRDPDARAGGAQPGVGQQSAREAAGVEEVANGQEASGRADVRGQGASAQGAGSGGPDDVRGSQGRVERGTAQHVRQGYGPAQDVASPEGSSERSGPNARPARDSRPAEPAPVSRSTAIRAEREKARRKPEAKPEPQRTGTTEGGRVDQTAAGDQLVLPGAEQITDRERAERAQERPMRGGDAPAGGLFDDGARDQAEMFTPGQRVRTDREVAARATFREQLRKIGVTWTQVEATESDFAGGQFTPDPDLITISTAFGTDYAENAVYHEALHAMRSAGVIRPAEWTALSRAANAHPDIKAWMADYRAWAPEDYWTPQRLEEEPVAEYVARVLSGQIKPDTGTPASRAVEKIRVVLRALASALRGQGFTTAAEVIDKIRKGEIAGRYDPTVHLGRYGPRSYTVGKPIGDGSASAEVAEATEAGGKVEGILAYHGSPHSFDRFDISKIGTGEGAQAYGHGLYFASNEDVAKSYRDQLSLDGMVRLKGRDGAIQFLEDSKIGATDQARDYADKAIASIRDGRSTGHMYEVRINAHPDDFLDWDKPLSQQNRAVRAALAPDPGKIAASKPHGIDATIIRRALKQNEGAWADIDMIIDNDRTLYHDALGQARKSGVTEDQLDDAGESPGSWMVKKYRAYIDLMAPTDDVSRMVKGREADLRDAGVPGIRYLDQGSRGEGEGGSNYVVFDDSLVTVTRKYTPPAFSRAAQDRVAAANAASDAPKETLALAPETRRQELWRRLKDDKNRLYQAQKTVEKLSGAPIPENIDGYLAAGLFQTKTSAAMKRYQDQTVASLLSDVKKVLRQTGATQKDLDDYLKAKHAPERNRVMAEKFPDRWSDAPGSGMSNTDAASIVSQAQSKGWEDGFERVAKKVYTLLRVDVANRVEAGLLAPETAAEWAKMYPDGRYVPLRGFAERDPDDPEAQVGRMNSGKGFDIRGKESREARGRSSDADSPIAYAIMMGAEGIVRISKNKVAKTLYRFAKEHPTDAVRPLGKMPTRAATDLKTGNTAIVINSEALNSPNIMAAKIGGKPYYMELSPELAVGMKNLGVDQLGGLSQMARKLTRYWSSMLTSRNPAFFIPNATVDFMTGILTSLQADAPRGFARRYVTGYAGALTALWQWNTGAPISAKWKQRISEWEEDGGRMDFYGYQNLDDIKEELGKAARETRSGRLKRGVKGALPAAFSAVEWLNTPFENAARFSAYNAARDLGVSRAKAAMHSLESTGNFAKRGEMTPLIGAWWPFFNASMTGLDQIASYGKHPATQAVLAGAVMMPMIWGLVAASMFPDDDDPEGVPLYFRVPEYERSKAIIIPRGVIEEEIENPDGSTRMVRRLDFNMIRIPHALRPFWTLGDQIAAAFYGGVSVGEIVSKTLVSALTNWNPISGSDPVSMMLPLVGDPIYELSTNRDGLGRAIRPEGFGGATEGVPAYSWHETKTSPVFIEAAQAMNDATGGDSVRPGMVSVHPDHLEYLWEFMTGGLGRFASEVAQTTQNAIEGVETPPSRIPILRTSMGRTDGRIQTDRFYDMLNEGEAMADALNSTKTKVRMGELGEAEWQQVLDLGAELGVDVGSPTSKNKWDGSWLNVLRKAQKAANGVRDEIRATKARTDISRAEVEAEVIRLQGRREAIMIAARTRALEIRAKQPER